MFGVGEAGPAALLVSGLLYQPYFLATFAMASLVTWLAPQTWDWTRSISGTKAAVILVLLSVAIGVLATQAYNPFIYFIF